MITWSNPLLIKKIGIRSGMYISVVNAPSNYPKLLGQLPAAVRFVTSLGKGLDLIHYFTTSYVELKRYFPKLKQGIKKDGMLWVSWPKGSSQINTDLKEAMVREIGLLNGLVDVKVIAVDDDWSGLKFVYRFSDR